MKKYGKQIFAFLLSFIMLFALVPTGALAEDKPLYDISETLFYGREALKNLENGENLVAAYDAIGAAVKSGKTTIMLESYNIPYSQDTVRMLLDTYNKDHPEDYMFPKGFGYTSVYKKGRYYIGNILLEYYTGFNDSLFNRMAKRLIDAVSDKETEYEKALALYNILQEYVEYDYDALDAYSSKGEVLDNEGIKAYNAYGAIVNGKAVCEGYAEAYEYLLQRVGIQSYIVTGTDRKGGNHEWNLLKLDGKYYYSDITWDDSAKVNRLYHGYFNITTARLLEGHTIDNPYGFLPECLSTEAFYDYENVFTSYNVDKLASIFKGGKKKEANFYFAGENDNFSSWWDQNYEAVFQKIKGLTPYESYSISYSSIGREYFVAVYPASYGATVGGKLLSWGESGEKTTVELFALDSTTPIYTTTLSGNYNYWYVDDIAAGTYRLRVSKADHRFEEYVFEVSGTNVTVDSSIFLLGDVTEDGIIDVRDFARAKLLFASGHGNSACDVDENGIIDAYDLVAVIEKIL